jgi:hypothetical protein
MTAENCVRLRPTGLVSVDLVGLGQTARRWSPSGIENHDLFRRWWSGRSSSIGSSRQLSHPDGPCPDDRRDEDECSTSVLLSRKNTSFAST